MKPTMRCVIGLAAIMTLCFVGTGLAADKTLTISSGPMGGDWYSLGGALGEMAKEVMPGAVVTVTTGGAVENLPKINGGHADAWIGPMVSGIVELTATVKMKMLPIAPSALDRLRDEDHYIKTSLPKDKYYFVKSTGAGLIVGVVTLTGIGLNISSLVISAWCRFNKSSRASALS